jgi:hypothetical protein
LLVILAFLGGAIIGLWLSPWSGKTIILNSLATSMSRLTGGDLIPVRGGARCRRLLTVSVPGDPDVPLHVPLHGP